MRHTTRTLFYMVVWFSLVVVACNLSGDTAPPTLSPRPNGAGGAAPTPQATIGLAQPADGIGGEAPTLQAGTVAVEDKLFEMMNEVQSDRLYRHVEALVGFRTRHVNSSQTSPNEGIGAAYRYIVDQFMAIQNQAPAGSFTVLEGGHEFTAYVDGVESIQHNAVAILNGTETGAGVIVVGAHYDSRTDDLLNSTANAPGAADNGSGVAAVIELARILSQYPQRSTIMFVLFSAEEHNRQGSRAFVQNYLKPFNLDVIGMVNIDTVGSWNNSQGEINDKEIRVFSSDLANSRQLARMAHFTSYSYGLDNTLAVTMQDGLDREGRYGDHFSFDEEGYPAIRFIEALEDTYNREGRDTLDKVEPAYMASATRTILAYVVSLAAGPRPPENISLRQDESSPMRSLLWEEVPGATSYYVVLRRPGSLGYDQWFIETRNFTNPTDLWQSYDSLAVAAVGADGTIGPLSVEYKIP